MARTLSEIVGSQNILDASPQTIHFSFDGMAPRLVLFPGDTGEVCEVLARASQEGVSVIPWGSGTKMEWGRIPAGAEWIVATKRLDRITDCDHENLTVTVDAGVPLSKVQKLLKSLGRGYFVPLDPFFSNTTTIGGVVATNSSGPKRYLYGTPRDLILGLGVVLPNGTRNTWGGKTVKNVAGYDMAKLYTGSFGTLGILTEAVIRIFPLPEREATLVVSFGDARTAFKTVSQIVQSEVLPSAVDVLNAKVIEALGLSLSSKRNTVVLAVDFEGFDESVRRQVSQMKEMIGPFHPLSVDVLEDVGQEAFWSGIREFRSAPSPSFPDSISCKAAVPISESAEAFYLMKEVADRIGLDDGFLRCHAGSGVVYLDASVPDSDPRTDDCVRVLDDLREKVKALQGGIVLQRAPLSWKRRMDVWGAPGKEFALMQRLKTKFDPGRVLNPGRFMGGI